MPTIYYEDIAVGDTFEAGGRTVTKAEIVDFADRFDPQPNHVDAEAAAETMFGGIIASGVHTFGICQRLATEALYGDSAMVVGVGADELRFPRPTYPGDTLSVEMEVGEKRPQGGRSDAGFVDIDVDGYNQDGDQVVSWTAHLIVEKRPTE